MNALMNTVSDKKSHRRAVRGLLAAMLAAGALSLCAVTANAAAAFPDTGGKSGFTGPGPAPLTVQEAMNLPDESYATMRGSITKSMGGDQYLFADETGSVVVEIDDEAWRGQSVGPDDKVEIQIEVDKDWGRAEFEVERLTKL